MKNVLKSELQRAFINRMFIVALSIGLAIVTLHVAFVAIPYGTSEIWASWRSGLKGIYPPTLHNTWIGQTGYSVFTTAFYYLLPLLACLPFASSLCSDISSGYASQVLIRSSRSHYFTAKAITIFLSSIVVVTIPLLVNIILTACFVPCLPPEPAAGTFYVAANTMLAETYYTHPNLYLIVFVMLAALVSGVFGLFAMGLSFFINNRFAATLVPFGVSIAVQFVFQNTLFAGFSPINIILPYQPYPSSFPIVICLIGVFLTALILYCLLRGIKYEEV